MPLDLLERVEIVKEEHLCVPAYLFYCNAMGNYTYDAGNIREHKTAMIWATRFVWKKNAMWNGHK